MIRIYSGWGNPGGSTVAFINLTNALNDAGYETCFYAPHNYPTNKCRFQQTNGRLQLEKDDILIAHFTDKIKIRPPVRKAIISSHEQNIFPLNTINYKAFDKIHFVSEHQRQYHNLNYPSFIIPNIIDDLKPNPNIKGKIAGIIGSIDRNKQVHVSITNALNDGCEQILLFGLITDQWYFQQEILRFLDNNKVKYVGYLDNKQQMYDMITDVYLSSNMECLPYVIGEAKLTGKIIHGIEGKNYLNCEYIFDKKEIVKRWVDELEINKNVYVNTNTKPKISAYFVSYNEEKIMPHLLRYYTSFCDKVTILDNNSTDKSCEIASKFKNVVVEKFNSNETLNDIFHANLKNSVWKRDIGKFDFVITSDADEFICHDNLIDFLMQKRKEGYTVFRSYGYHMVADLDFDLKEDDNIFDKVKYGVRVSSMDKFNLFDCNKIKEINLSVGNHLCNPLGEVKVFHDKDLVLKHFKFLGLNNYLESCRVMKKRLSETNIKQNMGTFYLEDDEYHKRDYMNFYNQRVLI